MDGTLKIKFILSLMASHSRTILPGLIICRIVYRGLDEVLIHCTKVVFRNYNLSVLTAVRKPFSAMSFTFK
jgi:hypothetical protein